MHVIDCAPYRLADVSRCINFEAVPAHCNTRRRGFLQSTGLAARRVPRELALSVSSRWRLAGPFCRQVAVQNDF